MFECAKELLKVLENKNYKAYIVGGFVRDKILNINSKDIDICTTATPYELSSIFTDIKIFEAFGAAKVVYKGYYFDITSLRKDIKYGLSRRDVTIDYVNTIEEDVLRRDFTINALYMDKDEEIYDLVNSKEDLDNKIIKTIGDPKKSICDDPIRILRAIRYAVKLNFSLDIDLYNAIKENKIVLLNLSYSRKKEELDKIFRLSNFEYFEQIVKELELERVLDIKFNNLEYNYDYLNVWSQIDFSNNYPFTKEEIEIINKYRQN